MENSEKRKYDGFYLMPGDEEDSFEFSFFTFKDDMKIGAPVQFTSVGDMFHVALFNEIEDGVQLNDTFEAIFADPVVYAKELLNVGLFGTFLRKTENSQEWWDNYLTKTKTVV